MFSARLSVCLLLLSVSRRSLRFATINSTQDHIGSAKKWRRSRWRAEAAILQLDILREKHSLLHETLRYIKLIGFSYFAYTNRST